MRSLLIVLIAAVATAVVGTSTPGPTMPTNQPATAESAPNPSPLMEWKIEVATMFNAESKNLTTFQEVKYNLSRNVVMYSPGTILLDHSVYPGGLGKSGGDDGPAQHAAIRISSRSNNLTTPVVVRREANSNIQERGFKQTLRSGELSLWTRIHSLDDNVFQLRIGDKLRFHLVVWGSGRVYQDTRMDGISVRDEWGRNYLTQPAWDPAISFYAITVPYQTRQILFKPERGEGLVCMNDGNVNVPRDTWTPPLLVVCRKDDRPDLGLQQLDEDYCVQPHRNRIVFTYHGVQEHTTTFKLIVRRLPFIRTEGCVRNCTSPQHGHCILSGDEPPNPVCYCSHASSIRDDCSDLPPPLPPPSSQHNDSEERKPSPIGGFLVLALLLATVTCGGVYLWRRMQRSGAIGSSTYEFQTLNQQDDEDEDFRHSPENEKEEVEMFTIS